MLSELADHLRHRHTPDLSRRALVAEIELISVARSALDAYQARMVVAIDSLPDKGLDGAGVLRSRGHMSGAAAARVSSTASKLGALPHTAELLAAGAITSAHANSIADAAKAVSCELADSELGPLASGIPADLFAKRCRQWVASHETPADASERHERQLRARSVRSWTDTDGMRVWLAKLDPITAAAVTAALEDEYERLWRLDGGRGIDPDSSVARTPQQRMADAFVNIVTARSLVSPTAVDEEPAQRAAPTAAPPARRQMIIVTELSRLRAVGAKGAASLIDGTPLPQSVLERLACNSDLTGVLFGGSGSPIWVGRSHRHATLAQWKALLARDRGCVGCGAAPNRCEAHHVVPWSHGGSTDISNLVLVCSRCHHDLHDRGMKLSRASGRWIIVSRAGPVKQSVAA